jgi:hypothetical protein
VDATRFPIHRAAGQRNADEDHGLVIGQWLRRGHSSRQQADEVTNPPRIDIHV